MCIRDSAQLDSYLDTDTNNVFVSRSHGSSNVNAAGTVTETMIFLGDGEGAAIYRSSGSINNLELSNMNLVMFIACYTADGGEGAANLPTAAVEQGLSLIHISLRRSCPRCGCSATG